MHCPLCGTDLRELEYEGVRIHSCDDCGGEVIGPDELRHIVRIREETFSDTLRAELESCSPTFGISNAELGQRRSLSCPTCQGPMTVLNYGNDSGVFIDRCQDCSTMFLDHEELEKIQTLMERWGDDAPDQIRAVSDQLEQKRRETAEATSRAFAGSRFAFVNALVNRLLDAA